MKSGLACPPHGASGAFDPILLSTGQTRFHKGHRCTRNGKDDGILLSVENLSASLFAPQMPAKFSVQIGITSMARKIFFMMTDNEGISYFLFPLCPCPEVPVMNSLTMGPIEAAA